MKHSDEMEMYKKFRSLQMDMKQPQYPKCQVCFDIIYSTQDMLCPACETESKELLTKVKLHKWLE